MHYSVQYLILAGELLALNLTGVAIYGLRFLDLNFSGVASLQSHFILILHVLLVQWTTRLLPFTRDPGSNLQGGTFVKPGFLLLALSRYIGDPDVIDHFCGLV